MSYLDVGAGPPALFMHEVGTNAFLWRHVLDAVRAQRRCIALDLPLPSNPAVDELLLRLPWSRRPRCRSSRPGSGVRGEAARATRELLDRLIREG